MFLSVETCSCGHGENNESVVFNSFSYCKSALCALYATRCFVFLQEETSQEMSAMQETRRLEEVNDSEMEIVTVVIFLEIDFILVCLILF
jgi:hypothetical protein